LDVVHLLVLKNNIFADALHGIQLAWLVIMFNKIHFAKCAFANELQNFEVFETCISLISTKKSFGTSCHRLSKFAVFIEIGCRAGFLVSKGVVSVVDLASSDVLLLFVVADSILFFSVALLLAE
jgi:hypothetical protein